MGDLRRRDDAFDLEVRVSGLLEVVEQPYAGSQQDGCQVELDLVEQPLSSACWTTLAAPLIWTSLSPGRCATPLAD